MLEKPAPRCLCLLAIILVLQTCFVEGLAQERYSLTVRIVSQESSEPLVGATIQLKGSSVGTSSDTNGYASIEGVPGGDQVFIVRFIGYAEKQLRVHLPQSETVLVAMAASEKELDEIVVTTSRTSRTIDNIPTRIEFIAEEELEEKITMQPGNIRMVLSESTGIQTQQTSASSANVTIRIQGLDGRYTQLLKDGFPLYGGFAGGLSIMQIPPLDLKQVEVIKGSASTLYGGGAIAGLVNLVSKTPQDERELLFFSNATSAGGVDVSSFYSEKFEKTGVTVFGSMNANRPYDPADIGFSAIPKFTRYTINPRIFFYNDPKLSVMAGLDASMEKRTGGDMRYLRGNGDATSWFERNDTERVSTQLSIARKVGETQLRLKNSFNFFSRDIIQRDYSFFGNQISSFTELNFEKDFGRSEWVGGANLWTDVFTEDPGTELLSRNFNGVTAGLFIQHYLEVSPKVVLESGMRLDRAVISSDNAGRSGDWLLLPRASLLFRWTENITSRVGGGFGYKTPTMFTEKAEEQVFRNVRPLQFRSLGIERSRGANADVNFEKELGDEASLSFNQLFFLTRLDRPLEFHPDSLSRDVYFFRNSSGYISSAGLESNMKLTWKDFILFAGYTLIDAGKTVSQRFGALPLTARHRINSVLMYELEDNLRIGLEAFYVGPQQLSNGSVTPDYWIFGFSAQKKWEKFSVFVNFENFTDTRQTRFENIYTGTMTNPVFNEIYAPLDGFVFNGGFFLRL